MSILVDAGTRVLVQGITGREGSFHTRQMLAYARAQGESGARIVGGVTPGNAFTGTTPGGVSDIYLYGGATMIAGAAPEMWFGDGIYDDITWTPTFVEPICNPGDADGDGDVDLDDFVILKNNFGQTGLDTQTSCSLGDFDLDGDVDLDDFVLLKNNFGNTY